MQGLDHYKTDEPDGYIRGNQSRFNPSVIIYNGIKGTTAYWCKVTGVRQCTMRERIGRYLAGNITIEQVVRPRNEKMAACGVKANRKKPVKSSDDAWRKFCFPEVTALNI